ncbi:MAG: hypothetical protein ACLFVU_04870 [Phycisphaerae bacterium]
MMTLYTQPDCADCRRLRERLENYHLAFRVEQADADADASRQAPALVDGEETVHGHREIEQYIEDVRDARDLSRRYQSDVCHDYGDDADLDLEK